MNYLELRNTSNVIPAPPSSRRADFAEIRESVRNTPYSRICGDGRKEHFVIQRIEINKGDEKMRILNIFKTRKKTLPEYFRIVLWSYDFETIDPIKDKKTIIINAINYGDLRHWKWLVEFYGKKAVTEVLKIASGTEIRPRVRSLVSILFSINNFNYEPRSFN
ncbi:hypothetical protein EPN15_04540 [Patescibacteria group bacterium]|nr:MAG: hypothetical protein EPN15_04540 [Patescibacteria group bacterium]